MSASTLRAMRSILLESARLTRYDPRRAVEAPAYVQRARSLHREAQRLAREARA